MVGGLTKAQGWAIQKAHRQQRWRGLFKKHGGTFHGPHVEHASCEEQAFWRFVEAVAEEAARNTEDTILALQEMGELKLGERLSAGKRRSRAALEAMERRKG